MYKLPSCLSMKLGGWCLRIIVSVSTTRSLSESDKNGVADDDES
jgi:hypothetical protein